MRMETVTAILCIHMLLWAACNAAPSVHKLGSDETLLGKAQPGKIFWRKLLEQNTSKPNVTTAETTNASIKTESDSVGAQDTGTQNADKADAKETAVLDGKIEMAKSDSTSLTAPHQEEVKSENVAPHLSTENDATKEEELAPQQSSKEEDQTDSNVVEPKESSNYTTETKEMEKTENSTTEAIAQSQIEESPTPGTKEDDAMASEQRVITEENASPQNLTEETSKQTKEKQDQIVLVKEESAGNKTNVEENKEGLDVDTQDKLQGNVKEELIEKDKNDSTPEQKNAMPGNVKTSADDQQETSTEESGTVIKSTERKEEPTEDNPIKMVETDSGEKQTDLNDDAKIKMVHSEPEGDDTGHIALDSPASIEEQASSNSSDNSNGEISNPSDIKIEDEKIEEKNEASDDNAEIIEKKDEENNSEEVSQEKSNETGEEKRESNNDNTETKDEESEKQNTEEVPQVKSEKKAEENHEPSQEIAEENHEPTEDNTEVKDKEGESNDAEELLQAKTDDETQAAANEVESQLEELKRDTVFDTTNDQGQERDPSDDEYDIIQELADLPTKFQETAGKVADHLRPDLRRWTDTSKEYFNRANQQISESFSPLIGKQYAPFFASMISYGILLLPLLVVILLFDHIKALFSLQKVLLFINIYLAAYFATLWLASFIIGLEPMSFFYHNSLSSYLSLQLLQALGYVVYLILQTANVINSCSSETRVGKVTSGLQWVVAMGIGLHYYVTVFHPAVASKPPHTSWKFYAIYSAAFFVLCLFARIRWVKKQYASAGNDMANKKS